MLFSGCSLFRPPVLIPEKALKKVSSFKYPDFIDDMDYRYLETSIYQSISYLEKLAPDKKFVFGKDYYSPTHLIRSLETFSKFIRNNPTTKELNNFIKKNYNVYKSVGNNRRGDVLFTGYYIPILHGSLNKSDVFQFPLYALPDDIVFVNLSKFSSSLKGKNIVGRVYGKRLVPYYDRNDIEYENAINKKAKKIVWLSSRIDRFFLQIQGSGKIILDNGDIINVGYHASNGRKYRSIGKLLLDQNKIDESEMSMQKIRSYLSNHPNEIKEVLSYNPSFVFFKIEENGPLGCINVPLTPERSIASDRKNFPQAALAYIESNKPLVNQNGEIITWQKMCRFVQNQDTGGAIKGTGRVDYYWGSGAYAELAAGHMQHLGKLFFLVLKPGL